MCWIENIKDEVRKGIRVLAPQPSHRRAFEIGMEIARSHHDFTYRQQSGFVDHPSGGFIHLAVDDQQVLGVEYHRLVGSGSDAMRSRVRLDYNAPTFESQGRCDG